MDLQAIGRCAARGLAVDLDNIEVPKTQVEDAMAAYEQALIHVFDVATQPGIPPARGYEIAKEFVTAAEVLIGCCLAADANLLEWAAKLAQDTRDSLRVLDARHWRREDVRAAMRAAYADEFRGRWAPLVDVY